MQNKYLFLSLITFLAISISAADREIPVVRKVSSRETSPRAQDLSPKKSPTFPHLFKTSSSGSLLSKKVDDASVIELRKKKDQQPRGFIARLKDDGNEFPHCYMLLNKDKDEIAKIHVHANKNGIEIMSHYLHIKLSDSKDATASKVGKMLLLWKNDYLNKKEIKAELNRIEKRSL